MITHVWPAANEAGRLFFFEKRTKNPWPFGVGEPASIRTTEQKSFASFLQKRRPSLP
jgi:hypothetical protein